MLSQDLRTEHFRQSMRRVASTVCDDLVHCMVVADTASTVTSVTSLGFAPISIACLRQPQFLDLRAARGRGALLHRCAASFAGRHIRRALGGARPTERRFDIGEWSERGGVPYLQSAQANLFCNELDRGSRLRHARYHHRTGRGRGIRL